MLTQISEVTAKTGIIIKTGVNSNNWKFVSLNETFKGTTPCLMES